MTSLTERAEQFAETGQLDQSAGRFYREPTPGPPQIDMSGYEPGDGDPEMVPVHIAWLRVRRDIGSIAKGEQYKERDRNNNNVERVVYHFRGVDTVVKAFGPVTLRHGVNVIPFRVDAEHRDTTSSRGNKMRECTVTVTWKITGPMGDKMLAQSAGEALDTSDKGTAKAQSVALRVLLLGAGLIPTSDDDPDSVHIDRGEAPVRQPSSYVAEITDPRTSRARLLQIHAELKMANQLDALVANETGDDEQIGVMVVRLGRERAAAEGIS